ncbi:uncharacterized protein EV420DRAFT_315050 [Desarmillaria tabescens]|uniref:Uncharacterized protein n=1 Tax=Armillaria tabescens TaxID=1929756 RepID=A0AA39N6L3_ARMTA|nr:uncharacterized protein EV420DRAFT_315050 [Desarmillaria tabescens]KAK0459318.1 hypothetical protein EV420DRAFT_315050 [Desarmillaria tabescens]
MIASCLASILFFGAALAPSFVAAAPPPAKRQLCSVSSVLTTLQSELSVILPQIDTLVSSTNASDVTITPLIEDVVSALDNATASLPGLTLSGTQAKILSVANNTVTEIAQTLDGLLSVADDVPSLGGLLSSVETSLGEVLSGVLSLVGGILDTVGSLLESLGGGLNGTLPSLG